MAQSAPMRTDVSADEFLTFPERFPPHSQLVEGHVIVSEPQLPHSRICSYLWTAFVLWCRAETGRGECFNPVDVPINQRNVFAPDISWYREDRRPPKGALRVGGLPDLAVEVRSQSTWRYDSGSKRRLYESNGLSELWLVDTASHTVIVNRRSVPDAAEFDIALELGEGEVLTSPLLPGLEIDIAELFDR